MKITIDIGKREIIWMMVIIALIITLGYAIAQTAFDPSKAWHPLQKIAMSESNLVSVDADNDNIIDNTENVPQACRLCQKIPSQPNACGSGYNIVQRGIFRDQSTTNDLGVGGYPSGCAGSMISPESGEFWLCCKG